MSKATGETEITLNGKRYRLVRGLKKRPNCEGCAFLPSGPSCLKAGTICTVYGFFHNRTYWKEV